MATQTITQPSLTASLRPSPLELYLTNLRLLDLDQRPDWPNITARTYAIRDAQNQKQRILCTEWALFRLFEMWSPDETQYVSVHRPSVILR
jgi:HAUS augmin-like complex subunit 6 N-terminus